MRSRLLQFGASVFLLLPLSVVVQAQQNSPPPLVEKPAPWLVSVIHEINIDDLLRSEGMSAAPVDGRTLQVTRNITTGLVIDQNGQILTRLVNLYRINARPAVTVKTADGRVFAAEFVGADRATGFTLLEVPGLGIAPPSFAEAVAQPGEMVTVKSPEFALKASGWQERNGTRTPTGVTSSFEVLVQNGYVTMGTASAAPHTINVELAPTTRVKSDLNAGVILNASGQVLGLTMRTYSSSNIVVKQVMQIDQARVIANKLLAARDRTPKLWLGAFGANLNQFQPEERKILNLPPDTDGVIVTSVMPGSPAWNAGLKLNDILVEVGSSAIHTVSDIQRTIAQMSPNQPTPLRVFRENQAVTLTAILQPANIAGIYNVDQTAEQSEVLELQVKQLVLENLYKEIGARKAEASRAQALQELMKRNQAQLDARAAISSPAAPASRPLPLANFGVTIQDLTPQLAEYFGVPGRQGVLVVAVDPRLLGANARIQAGDVILMIDGRPVPPASDSQKVSNRPQNLSETHRIQIVRDRKPQEIVVRIYNKPSGNDR